MSSSRSSRKTRVTLALVGLSTAAATAVALIGPASATTPTTSGANGGRKVVATKPAWVAKTKPVGTPSTSATHQLSVGLKTNQAAATAYAQSVNDPKSPNYRKFLTPTQYAKKFGASTADVASAKKWLSGQGLTVGKLDASRSTLTVSGPTTAVDKAFGVGLKTFKHESTTVTAPTSTATVPSDATAIQSVLGLDTTPRYHSNHASQAQMLQTTGPDTIRGVKRPDTVAPAADSVSGRACSDYFGEFTAKYQEPNSAPFTKPLPSQFCGFTPKTLNKAQGVNLDKGDGKGVTVGFTLWCDDPRLEGDTNHWSQQMGVPQLKSGQLTISHPTGGYDADQCDNLGTYKVNLETALDTEAIHGAAPGANIVFSSAGAPTDAALLDSFHRLVDADSVDIISNSWGGDESGETADVRAAWDQVFTQAAAEGISVLYASGDSGDGSAGGTKAAAPEFPASDPWVTSVGGTNLGTDKSGKKSFESAWLTAGTTMNTAKADGSWQDWSFAGGGGGGKSAAFAQPYYQKGVVPTQFAGSTPMRVYPDLANVADPATEYQIGFTNTVRYYSVVGVGGTSLASPRTAGQLALTIQANGGHDLGFLNPTLYTKGGKYLTDLSSNKASKAYIAWDHSWVAIGWPVIPDNFALNAQSMFDQSLTLGKGYDNLSGMGAVDNQSKLNSLFNSK